MRSTHSGTCALAALAGFAALVGTACQDEATSPGSSVPGPQFASSSSLPHINNTHLMLPVALAATMTADECSNNPGPRITFEGTVTLGGFGVGVVFRNNLRGTHENEQESTVNTTVLDVGEPVTIPKQPVLGGTGGNPFIWVQLEDEDGHPLTGEIFVGRCVQGSNWRFAQSDIAVQSSATAEFEVVSCENSPGPFINLGSGVAVGGLGAQIIFRNNDNPVGGPHRNDEVRRSITLIPAGLSYSIPKQPVQGGVGGNPWISAFFTDGAGTATSDETLLGRCEQLSKALSG